MYTQDDEKRLFELSKRLMDVAHGNEQEVIDQLKEVINYADWKY
jgi:hypothetical protein